MLQRQTKVHQLPFQACAPNQPLILVRLTHAVAADCAATPQLLHLDPPKHGSCCSCLLLLTDGTTCPNLPPGKALAQARVQIVLSCCWLAGPVVQEGLSCAVDVLTLAVSSSLPVLVVGAGTDAGCVQPPSCAPAWELGLTQSRLD